ncbi:MAG: PAS domain S-box protein [Candidatus Brocadiales bacterium]
MSIRRKLTIILIFVSIIPLAALGLIALRNSKNALKEKIAVSSLEYANLAMTTINVYLQGEYEENQILSGLYALQDVVNNDRDGRISELLTTIEALEYDKDDYYLACLNVKGQVVASSNPEIIGIDFSAERWCQEALNGKDGMQDVTYHKPAQGYAIILYSTIKDMSDPTKVIGVMFTPLKWEDVNKIVIGLKVGGEDRTQSNHIMLTNKDGLVISCFNPGEMFTDNLIKIGMKSAKYAQEGKEGHLTETSEHGILSFATYSHFKKYRDMPNLGWLLVMHQDPKSAFATVARLQKTFIFIGIITGIFIVAISFIVSKTLSKPILSIANAAQAIGKGDLKRKVPVTSKDEVGILADSFNKMTDELEKAITEQRQTERNLELSVRQQAMVANIGIRALAGIDLQVLMDEVVTQTCRALNVEYCKVLELLPGGRSLLLRAGTGWMEGLVGRATVGTERDSQASYTLLSKEPVIVEDLRTETRFSGPQLLRDHGVVSGMSVIIQDKDTPYGVFGVHTTKKRIFTKDDIYFIQAMANVLAEAIGRKRAEEELKKYKILFDNTSDLAYIYDTKGNILFVNRIFEKLSGHRPEEFFGKPFAPLFNDEDLKKAMDVYTRTLKGEHPQYELHFKDTGTLCEYKNLPLRDKDENIIGVIGIARDITERKRMIDQNKTIIRTALDGFGVTNTQGQFLEVNDAYCRLIGYSREELLKMNIPDVEALETPEDIAQRIQKMIKTGGDLFESKHKCKDGKIIDVEISINFMDIEGGRFFAFVRDITERKRAEEELRMLNESLEQRVAERTLDLTISNELLHTEIAERKRTEEKLRASEQDYRSIFENAMDGIVTSNLEGKLSNFNDTYVELTGYSREELLNLRYQDITPPKYHDMEAERVKTLLETGVPQEFEKEYIRKNGSRIPLLLKTSVIKDDTGKPRYLLAITKDMALIKKAEQVLRASEKKYRTLIENLPQKIFHKDINSIYVSCNDSFAKEYNIKPDEIAGKSDYDFVPKDLAGKYRVDDKRIMASGRTEDIEEKYVKDGQEFFIQTVKTPIRDEKGSVVGVLGIFWDITGHKKAEDEIRYLNEYLKTILESIDVYIRVVNPKLNVEYENPPLKKRFGDGVGKPCYLAWQRNLPCENCTSERAILTNSVQRKEETLPDGQIFSVTSVPIKTRDGRSSAVEIIYDVTRLKQSEYEIRSLTSRILSAQEEERKRISRELHDETGQAITAIKINLKLVEQNFRKNVPDTKRIISDTKQILTQVMKDIKRLSYDLRPAMIDDLGMVPAIQSYARELAERTGINVVVKSELVAQRFPQEVEISLYRILQEALTNVVKHSKAKNVKIELLEEKTTLVMKVGDDGCGFDTEKVWKGKLNKSALGLIGIRERATILRGNLEITSARNKGTKLIVRLPLSVWHIHS